MKRRKVLECALGMAALVGARGMPILADVPAGSWKIPAISRLGKELLIASSDIKQLRGNLKGVLLLPTDQEYESARKLWNGAFDHRPALIARCASASDVVAAVKFARALDLLTAVRGGGHSISGQSGCTGGLIIDLSLMKDIRIDAAACRASVQPGVRLGEIDRAAQAMGLITTMGTAPDTGIAGLTLGGGIGRLARKFGLACDNLLAVDVVTAKGELLHASEKENTDLFWAVRGGGGNFGVVTRFEYQLHPFGPDVLSGAMVFPAIHAERTLANLMEFSESAPDEMYLAPSIAVNGTTVAFEMCYCGLPAEGERLIAPLRKLQKVLLDRVKVESYLAVQARDDAGWPAGRNYYFKSGFLKRQTGATSADLIVESISQAPAPLKMVAMLPVGGAAGRFKPEATAYWNRHAELDLLVWGSWPDGGESGQKHVEAMRAYWRILEPTTDGYYINTDASDNEQRLRNTYGGNYDRLLQVKNRYDPTNFFRLNANIRASGLAAKEGTA